jgi:hypothetical protein
VLRGDAGVVAAQEIEPTVGAATDGVGCVLAAGDEREDQFRRLGASLAVGVAPDAQTAVAHAEQVVAVPAQAHRSVLRSAGEVDGFGGLALAVLVQKQTDVTATGNDDPALRIDGHAIDVVGEIAAGELGDLEAVRHADTGSLGGDDQRQQQEQRNGEETRHGEIRREAAMESVVLDATPVGERGA